MKSKLNMLCFFCVYLVVQTYTSSNISISSSSSGCSPIGRGRGTRGQRRTSRSLEMQQRIQIRSRSSSRSRSRSNTVPFRSQKFQRASILYGSDSRSSSTNTQPMHEKSTSFTIENKTGINIQDIDYLNRMPSNEIMVSTNDKEKIRELNPLHQQKYAVDIKSKTTKKNDDEVICSIDCKFTPRQKICLIFIFAWIFLIVLFVLIFTVKRN